MTKNNRNYKPMPVEIPSDDEHFYNRPFFAYGIFKKGQLAYSKIEDCIKNVQHDEIPCKMHIRDGVPVIKKEFGEFVSKGDKIYFHECKKEDAYKIISNTQPGNIYKWDTVDIDGITFNFLSTENLRGTYINVDDNKNYLNSFNGRRDPFFFKAPEFIRDELQNLEYGDEYFVFRIQMLYTLLWSAIDRYCTLKYDVSVNQNDYLRALSNDELFEEAFSSIRAEKRGPIHSARNATPYYFNRAKPSFIINHYYTVRSNVVHRGKEPENKIDDLERSLWELLEIFENIIDKTFDDLEDD